MVLVIFYTINFEYSIHKNVKKSNALFVKVNVLNRTLELKLTEQRDFREPKQNPNNFNISFWCYKKLEDVSPE